MTLPAVILRPAAALGLVAGLLLGACAAVPAEPVWTKAGTGDAERQAAFDRCMRLAEADDTVDRTTRRERQAADVRGNAFLHCMIDDGWVQVRPE